MALTRAVDSNDHVQGSLEAPIVLVQYGDFECPYSGAAYPAVQEVQAQQGDQLCYVFRQFPLYDIHPHSLHAAEAAEAAAAQDRFWPMYELLFQNQHALQNRDLLRYAEEAGLDIDQFKADMSGHTHLERVKQSIENGQHSKVHGTPTFFINGEFHGNREGLWDADALLEAIENTKR
jgi:protein-disulfide isomerase